MPWTFASMVCAAALAAVPTPAAPAELAGTSWRLVRFQGGDDATLVPEDRDRYTLDFQPGGGLAARIDCNRGRGKWTVTPPAGLALGPLALTRAMCPPSPLTDRLAKDWTYVRSYVVKDGHLFLSLQADAGTYELEPASRSDAGTPLEGTRWKLVRVGDRPVSAPPSPRQAHLIFDAESHRVSGAGGCNRLSGDYERNGEQLTFSKMAGTMMACADGMEAEKAFLEALTKVKSFRIADNDLELLDGDGKVLAAFEASPAPAAET